MSQLSPTFIPPIKAGERRATWVLRALRALRAFIARHLRRSEPPPLNALQPPLNAPLKSPQTPLRILLPDRSWQLVQSFCILRFAFCILHELTSGKPHIFWVPVSLSASSVNRQDRANRDSAGFMPAADFSCRSGTRQRHKQAFFGWWFITHVILPFVIPCRPAGATDFPSVPLPSSLLPPPSGSHFSTLWLDPQWPNVPNLSSYRPFCLQLPPGAELFPITLTHS